MRAITSAPPPGENGTITRTGLEGYGSAAGLAVATNRLTAKIASHAKAVRVEKPHVFLIGNLPVL
jgi:hypothetical protein